MQKTKCEGREKESDTKKETEQKIGTKPNKTKPNKIVNIERRSYLVSESYKKLKTKKVAIIGVGGTGNIVASLLARAGIGKLILIDRDIIEESNLERQLLYDTKDIGKSKADVAKEKLNIFCDILSYSMDLTFKNIVNFELNNCDLIIDCTDNLETRMLLNDYCKKNKINWIYTGAIKNIGTVFFNTPNGPCINCFLNKKTGDTCATSGVTNSCVSIIGSLATSIATNHLCFEKTEEKLVHINIDSNEFTKINVSKNKTCDACNGKYNYLSGKNAKITKELCGSGTFSFVLDKNIRFRSLKKKLGFIGKLSSFGNIIKFNDITIFSDGRVLIKAKSEKEAKKIYAEYIGN